MIALTGYSGRWPGLRGHEPFGSVACWLPVKICIFTELSLSRLIQASLGPPRGRSQAAVAYQLPAETYVSAEFFFHEILERERIRKRKSFLLRRPIGKREACPPQAAAYAANSR